MSLWPGRPHPLGATFDGGGVNFALFSREAEAVDLCVFEYEGTEAAAERRLPMPERTDLVWHGYLPGAKPGLRYGYRVRGPWQPAAGLRFNEAKLLLDPYARLVARPPVWNDALFAYVVGKSDLDMDARDSAPYAPLGVVTDTRFNWGKDAPPATPWHKTVIYEAHVKGLTKLHPGVPRRLRGTYAGAASKPVIEHLKSLGVTAVELMPCHQKADERHLVEKGLSNYWGYNTLSYFAPERSYAAVPDDAVGEFKRMVRSFHAAGLEVILDVVYNHTAEGSHLGPTLSLRGIDNRSYYRLAGDQRYYEDFSGCGNTLNVNQPRALQFVMDSLRYWACEMRVDGFRFDLAPALARKQDAGFGPFFEIIRQDPLLSGLKLIAEPWDVGPGGYQVGNFPPGWAEWNGVYRDTVRGFWDGGGQSAGELATRLSGSSDLYQKGGRRPYASINFVTCHDGLTLEDLVRKEDGPDPAARKRSLLATLLLSQGVPMLAAGDELGRSQDGDANAYCQDNERSWLRWKLDAEQQAFLEFARLLARIRAEQPALRRTRFLAERDVSWLTPEGAEMTPSAWNEPGRRCLAARLAGRADGEVDERGRPVTGDDLLILINAGPRPVSFALPPGGWKRLIDTAPGPEPAGAGYELAATSVALFRAGAA